MVRAKAAVIMAAGQGTRMRSGTTKVLHPVAGRPMIHYSVRSALELNAQRVVLVLGHQRHAVADYLSSAFPGAPIETVVQAEQLGTAHAVMCAADALADFDGDVFILSGDVPTMPTEIIRRLDVETGSHAVGVLGMELDEPKAYGRLVTDDAGRFTHIVEARDCTPAQLDVREVNAGVYRADARLLFSVLSGVGQDNAQGEFYLTDVVAGALHRGESVTKVILRGDEAGYAFGVNDRRDLAAAEAAMQTRLRTEAMKAGVTFIDPQRVILHDGVQIGADTVIEPDVSILGASQIGSHCHLEQGSRIENAKIGETVHLKAFSHLENVEIGDECQVGPYARLRPGTILDAGVKIGNFVETKKAHFAAGAKASHLSYIGDATVGAKANIGAGTITCNYDGYNKFKTEIGAGAFIGSDTQLVAPVKVGAGAIVAAGTTVTQDVPTDALSLSRVRQENKSGWAAKKRQLEAAKKG